MQISESAQTYLMGEIAETMRLSYSQDAIVKLEEMGYRVGLGIAEKYSI